MVGWVVRWRVEMRGWARRESGVGGQGAAGGRKPAVVWLLCTASRLVSCLPLPPSFATISGELIL